MATVANLVVEISTKSAKLKKGLTKSLQATRKFANSVGKMMVKLGAAITASLVGATILFVKELNNVAAEIDLIAKTSEKLGLTAEALQKLQFSAKLSGVNVNTLNMALQRMVRRVAEAAQGTGEAKDALKELGIDAKSLVQLSPDKQFEKIAVAFKNIKNRADQVRIAMKLFDSEGVALVNTLNADLAKTNKEFESLGVTLTKSQTKMVEAYQDSKTKLDTIWEGFKQQVVANMAEPLTLVVGKITEFVQSYGGADKVALAVSQSIGKGVLFVFDAFTLVVDTVLTLKEDIIDLGRVGLSIMSKLGNGIKSVFVGVGTFIGESVGKAQVTVGNFADSVRKHGLTGKGGVPAFLQKQSRLPEGTATTSALESFSKGQAVSSQIEQQFLASRAKTLAGRKARSERASQIRGGISGVVGAIGGQGGAKPIQVNVTIKGDAAALAQEVAATAEIEGLLQKATTKVMKDSARQFSR